MPPLTHPGDHLSTRAIGHSVDWFARTLDGRTPLPAGDQIWTVLLRALLGGVIRPSDSAGSSM